MRRQRGASRQGKCAIEGQEGKRKDRGCKGRYWRKSWLKGQTYGLSSSFEILSQLTTISSSQHYWIRSIAISHPPTFPSPSSRTRKPICFFYLLPHLLPLAKRLLVASSPNVSQLQWPSCALPPTRTLIPPPRRTATVQQVKKRHCV